MKYEFTDLVDLEQFKQLMDDFYYLTKIPHGLLDCEGNILSAVGWQDICVNFHRAKPNSEERCRKSDLSVNEKLGTGQKYGVYRCLNGLMEVYAPVIIGGEHIGTLFLGQFLFEEPDYEYFRRQAVELGFDVDTYMEAVSKIPIITEDKVEVCMSYYAGLAKMLSNMGFTQMKQKEAEEALVKNNEMLENTVKMRTIELLEINEQLEKDIAERKRIEKELTESEERYRHVIELLPYGVIVRIGDEFLFANSTAAKYLGQRKPDDIIGKRIADIFYPHPDYEHAFPDHFRKVRETGYLPLTEEKFIRKSDGEVIDVETVSCIIPYNGQTAALVVFRDISERKRLVELNKKIEENTALLNETLEYDRIKTEFFANISHELRTPLNVILSALQISNFTMKSDDDIDIDKIKKYLNIMKQNTYRLIRLVNNLIDITRIDSGYFKVNMVNCNIVSIVEEITLSVAEYIENSGINLIFDTDVEEKIVACDPDKIERIVLNLLSNAVKYTKPGGNITVKIIDGKEKLTISVKDTGIGIPKEKQRIVFERFIQVDKSLSRNHEGSGIGLSLVKSLVEMHGGRVSLKSTYGQGSEFLVDLPLSKHPKNANEEDEDYSYGQKVNIETINIEFSDIYF